MTSVLEKACAILEHLCTSPPQLPYTAGSFMVLWRTERYAEALNEHLNAALAPPEVAARRPVFALAVRAIDVLLRQMLTRLSEFARNVNMRLEPASAVMGLFCVMAQLVVVVEDAWAVFEPADGGPRWRCATEASGFAFVAQEELCVTATRVKSYTVRDLVRTVDLLALRWHRLRPHAELTAFLHALLHRACILAAHPGPARVFDAPEYCCVLPGSDLHHLSRDGLRMVSQPLLRMLYTADIERVLPSPDPPPPDAAGLVACVRAYMQRQVEQVKKLGPFKKQVSANFDRYMILHGDREKWTARRGVEEPRAPSLVMTVRAFTKPADTRLREFVLVDRLVALTDERDADYHDRWTRAEHVLATLCKLYLATTVLAARNIDLFTDYATTDLELPFSLPRFAGTREPVLVQMFGRIHVVFAGTLIRCICIEHAVAVWALVILNRLGGVFLNTDVAADLGRLLTPVAAATETELVSGVVVDD